MGDTPDRAYYGLCGLIKDIGRRLPLELQCSHHICLVVCNHRACLSLGWGVRTTDTGDTACRWEETTLYYEEQTRQHTRFSLGFSILLVRDILVHLCGHRLLYSTIIQYLANSQAFITPTETMEQEQNIMCLVTNSIRRSFRRESCCAVLKTCTVVS